MKYNASIIGKIPYNTKLQRDKTFAVRSPCEYSWKNLCVCIKTTYTSAKTLKFTGKHLRFKQYPEHREGFGP